MKSTFVSLKVVCFACVALTACAASEAPPATTPAPSSAGVELPPNLEGVSRAYDAVCNKLADAMEANRNDCDKLLAALNKVMNDKDNIKVMNAFHAEWSKLSTEQIKLANAKSPKDDGFEKKLGDMGVSTCSGAASEKWTTTIVDVGMFMNGPPVKHTGK